MSSRSGFGSGSEGEGQWEQACGRVKKNSKKNTNRRISKRKSGGERKRGNRTHELFHSADYFLDKRVIRCGIKQIDV